MEDDAAEIKIAYDLKDIESKSQEEKLNLLLKIAFLNHSTLEKYRKVLFGNGEAGVCELTRQHKVGLKFLYWFVFLVSGGFASLLYMHLMDK